MTPDENKGTDRGDVTPEGAGSFPGGFNALGYDTNGYDRRGFDKNGYRKTGDYICRNQLGISYLPTYW